MRPGRLDLPIDHFRLLGVSPASDAQTVLRTLDHRLDRVPDQGFTTETLQARARLLHDSADLLSDSERRQAYECELTAVAEGPASVPALDIPSHLEVAGLLLLLEAGQPQEVFDLACRALQPPQAPALGSSREADLSLLAGLACQATARESRAQRLFEASSLQLRQGLQLLQRMGQLPELRQRLAQDLDALTPYLVLDLLSRELTAGEKRAEGLELLEQLVSRRGGLEGDRDPAFSSEEFQPFFKQIRGFLTVQEQVDLFSRWAEAGSETADFLATIALTASGFAQRKPERIAAARQRLLASGRSGIEPLLANLHLLLGEVDTALALFAGGAGDDLRAWAERQSPDPLGQLCAYCRDWLLRDVLPGYRDLEADPDLDAYFADRDVIAWVEREDRRSGRHFAAVDPEAPAGPAAVDGGSSPPSGGFGWSAAPLEAGGAPGGFSDTVGLPAPEPFDPDDGLDPDEVPPPRWRLPGFGAAAPADRAGGDGRLADPGRRLSAWRPAALPLPLRVLAVVSLALGAAVAVIQLRPLSPRPPARGVVTLPVQPAAEPPVPAAPQPSPGGPRPAQPPAARPPEPAAAAAAPLTPLRVAEPSDTQLRDLLSRWLAVKAAVLAGDEAPADLDGIAREAMVERLGQERRQDAAAGQRQTIDVTVDELRLIERSGGRIAVQARLTYSDRRLDASGRVL